jgi:hypothetical protein
MTAENERLLIYLGVGAAAALVLFPDLMGKLIGKLAVGTGVAAGNIVVKTGEGLVIGVGEAVGIPQTDLELCEQYVQQGLWTKASFYCPAGTFLKSATGAVYDSTIGKLIGWASPGKTEVITLNITSPEESGLAEQYVYDDPYTYMDPLDVSP